MSLERLRQLMQTAKVEQKELAEELGYSEPSISRYLSGTRSWPEGFADQAEAFLLRKARELMQDLKQTAGVNGR